MNLTNYVSEPASKYSDITFMENAGTRHRIVLKRAEMERGINELKAYQSMGGSPLIDYAIDQGGVVMMLQRYDGESLADMLEDREKRAALSENIRAVLDSAVISLKKLHGFGVCHGSISPEKLIISDDFSVRFIGYGNASNLESPAFSEAFTMYTAPEVVLGGSVDARLADYYSLGRTLGEILRDAADLHPDYEAIEIISRLTSIIPEHRDI